MKVQSSGDYIPPVTKTNDIGSAKPVDKKAPKTSHETNQSSTQSHIKEWFAKAGVASETMSNDVKGRYQAIERRRHILAARKMANLQSIMNIAMSVNISEQHSEQLDPDWFYSFIQLAENVHSPVMQELWGKIFAVEVGKPGSFSMRTLETLKVLTQKDARVFSKAASVASRRQNQSVPKILVGFHQRKGFWSFIKQTGPSQLNLSNYGLSYPDLLSLIDMKLIYASEIESGELNPTQRSMWRCGNYNLNIAPRKQGLALVYYKFTSVGAELFRLAPRQTPPDYIEGLKEILHPVFEIDG